MSKDEMEEKEEDAFDILRRQSIRVFLSHLPITSLIKQVCDSTVGRVCAAWHVFSVPHQHLADG